MSALAGPGPTTSAYQQAQKQSLPPSTSSTVPVSTTNHGTAVLAPLGGVADAQVDTEPNTFTEAQLEEFKEQDRYLPIANVGRIMKNALPSNAKIAKEAKECVQECVSEFISFLSSEAADKVLTDKRKTINGEDILYAMTALGFDNYQEAGRVYLAKYRNYINEHPHRPSHHERTAPSSAQASNRNTPHPTLPPLNTSMNTAEPSMNSASFGSEFGGAFNAFVNGDELDGDEEDGDDGIDDDDLEDELEDDSPIEKTNGKKNQVAGGKKTVKRKAGEGGPPGKKAKVKGGAAAVTTGPAKKGPKKP